MDVECRCFKKTINKLLISRFGTTLKQLLLLLVCSEDKDKQDPFHYLGQTNFKPVNFLATS